MAKKYQSELLGVIYEEARANYEADAIDKKRLFTYDEACLVQEPPVSMEALKDFAVPAKTARLPGLRARR